jgi:hypothetical protein
MVLTVQQMVDEVSAALDAKLGMRGRTLAAQVRKAGRLLPRGVKRDATYLAQTVDLSQNPKLSRMVDIDKVSRAHANVLAFLAGVDRGAQRRTAALNMIASIAFVFLVTGIVLLFVLVQRGFI